MIDFLREIVKPKNLARIGQDAVGIFLCGFLAFFVSGLIPILRPVTVYLGVAAGIWLYKPIIGKIRQIVDKVRSDD